MKPTVNLRGISFKFTLPSFRQFTTTARNHTSTGPKPTSQGPNSLNFIITQQLNPLRTITRWNRSLIANNHTTTGLNNTQQTRPLHTTIKTPSVNNVIRPLRKQTPLPSLYHPQRRLNHTNADPTKKPPPQRKAPPTYSSHSTTPPTTPSSHFRSSSVSAVKSHSAFQPKQKLNLKFSLYSKIGVFLTTIIAIVAAYRWYRVGYSAIGAYFSDWVLRRGYLTEDLFKKYKLQHQVGPKAGSHPSITLTLPASADEFNLDEFHELLSQVLVAIKLVEDININKLASLEATIPPNMLPIYHPQLTALKEFVMRSTITGCKGEYAKQFEKLFSTDTSSDPEELYKTLIFSAILPRITSSYIDDLGTYINNHMAIQQSFKEPKFVEKFIVDQLPFTLVQNIKEANGGEFPQTDTKNPLSLRQLVDKYRISTNFNLNDQVINENYDEQRQVLDQAHLQPTFYRNLSHLGGMKMIPDEIEFTNFIQTSVLSKVLHHTTTINSSRELFPQQPVSIMLIPSGKIERVQRPDKVLVIDPYQIEILDKIRSKVYHLLHPVLPPEDPLSSHDDKSNQQSLSLSPKPSYIDPNPEATQLRFALSQEFNLPLLFNGDTGTNQSGFLYTAASNHCLATLKTLPLIPLDVLFPPNDQLGNKSDNNEQKRNKLKEIYDKFDADTRSILITATQQAVSPSLTQQQHQAVQTTLIQRYCNTELLKALDTLEKGEEEIAKLNSNPTLKSTFVISQSEPLLIPLSQPAKRTTLSSLSKNEDTPPSTTPTTPAGQIKFKRSTGSKQDNIDKNNNDVNTDQNAV